MESREKDRKKESEEDELIELRKRRQDAISSACKLKTIEYATYCIRY